MFTGLVEEVGTVVKVETEADGKRFIIACQLILDAIKIGDSICVSGACQTVESFNENSFTIFSIPETLKATNYDAFTVNKKVNLERALRLSDRIGGHLVQGHVEETALVKKIEKQENHWNITIAYSSAFVIPKGSITIDGISLTIQEVGSGWFRVQIIPETIKKTNLEFLNEGDQVNIETDYVIKSLDYVHRWRESN